MNGSTVLLNGLLATIASLPGPTITETAQLRPSGGGPTFGNSLAMRGDLMVVGAPDHAYVFRKNTGGTPEYPSDDTWTEEAKLSGSGPASWLYFGRSVDVEGERVVVGAPADDVQNAGPGRVYVFRHDAGGWVQEVELASPAGDSRNHFGESVGISGDALVAGAPAELEARGRVYVFRRSGTSWLHEGTLTAQSPQIDDHFGARVAIEDDLVAVGFPRDPQFGYNSGSAYVFRHSSGDWAFEDRIVPFDPTIAAHFGSAIDIDHGTLAIGAFRATGAVVGSGAVYFFENNAGTWVQTEKVFASDGANLDDFGRCVDLDADTLIVGSPNDDYACPGTPGCRSGSGYVFRRVTGEWFQIAKLLASDADLATYVGFAVAMTGHECAASAFAIGGGVVYLFDVEGIPPPIPAVSLPGAFALGTVLVIAAAATLRRRSRVCGAR